jgi:hypothetical protein
LVVLAEADGETQLPFDLEVEGEKIAGHGKLLYQCALELEHTGGTALPTTGPLPEQKSKGPPPFDPAAFHGNMNELTPQDRQTYIQYLQKQRVQPQQRRR